MDEQHQITRQAVSVADDGSSSGTENLVKPKAKLEVRKNFFSCRVVDPWNNLPNTVRKSGTVNEFKKNYDDFMAGK